MKCTFACLNVFNRKGLYKIAKADALPFTAAGTQVFGLYWRKVQ